MLVEVATPRLCKCVCRVSCDGLAFNPGCIHALCPVFLGSTLTVADSEDDSMLDLGFESMCLDLLDGIETEKKVPSNLRLSTLAKKFC